jgi:cytochrome b
VPVEAQPAARIALWDWPVRLCHWLFVLLIPLAWWTAEEHMFDWHLRIGILMLALLVFRIIWGFVGSSTARFANFLRGPAAASSYLRGQWPETLGHNPIGGWSAAALLTLMLVQVGLGLFATDEDGLASGPLNPWVSFEAGERIKDLHEANFNLLLAFIAVHVAAILFYAAVKRTNLVAPMITGWVAKPRSESMRAAPHRRAALAAVAALAFAYWIFLGAPT